MNESLSLMREFHIDELSGATRPTEDFRAVVTEVKEFIAGNGCPVSILLYVADGEGEESHHYVWGHSGPTDAAVASVEELKSWARERHPRNPVGFVLVMEKDGRPLGREEF